MEGRWLSVTLVTSVWKEPVELTLFLLDDLDDFGWRREFL